MRFQVSGGDSVFSFVTLNLHSLIKIPGAFRLALISDLSRIDCAIESASVKAQLAIKYLIDLIQ